MDPFSMVISKRMKERTEEFVSDLEQDLRRLYGDVEMRTGEILSRIVGITSDLRESEDEFTLVLDLPGVDKDGIDLRVIDDRIVEVVAERMEEVSEEETYLVRERVYGPIKRKFILPAKINADEIDAKFTRGVLTVKMVKEEAARRMRVPIR